MSEEEPEPELWVVEAAVRQEVRKGPGGTQVTSGTKHFRGGAKVYVIDAFWGISAQVTVIGQHRRSRAFICIAMPARHLENLRLKLVYSPTVRRMMLEHFAKQDPPGREYAESLCEVIPRW